VSTNAKADVQIQKDGMDLGDGFGKKIPLGNQLLLGLLDSKNTSAETQRFGARQSTLPYHLMSIPLV